MFFMDTSTKTDTNTIHFVRMMYSGSEMVIRCQVARFIAYNPKERLRTSYSTHMLSQQL